jgi:ATP-dependent Clp protease protease subunit
VGRERPGAVDALAAAGDRAVHLHINSPGGDVFEARAMAAAVVAHPATVTSHIDGLSASAATYLAMAANEVRMTDGGLFMIHNSWTMAWGDKSELRSTADLLQKIDGTIAADYARQTGKTLDEVVAWMDATTWFTAAEAKDAGFVDAIDANTKRDAAAAAARWNLSAYANAPKLEQPEPDAELAARVAAQLQTNRNRVRMLALI